MFVFQCGHMCIARDHVAVVVLVLLERQLLVKQEAEPAQDRVLQRQDAVVQLVVVQVLLPHFQLLKAFLVCTARQHAENFATLLACAAVCIPWVSPAAP